jgi:cupin-like protein
MTAAAAMIEAAEPAAFTSAFPSRPFAIRHKLVGNPLFSLASIVDLVRQLPADSIEYNSGKVSIGQDASSVPVIDLDPAEVVRRIETCGAWMVLKSVEAHPAYRAVLEQTLLSVARANGHASLKDAGFEDIRGFMFVSSPNATTPFHVDSEDNFFVHIHGDKYFTVCDNRDGSVVSDDEIEHSITKHRNVAYSPAYESKSTCYSLQPGEGVFVPYLWPHWVRTGSQYSISFAVTWKTKAVMRKNDIFVVNSILRRCGFSQRPPGHNPALDVAKHALFRMAKAVVDPLRKSAAIRAVVRRLVLGRGANYFVKTAKPAA